MNRVTVGRLLLAAAVGVGGLAGTAVAQTGAGSDSAMTDYRRQVFDAQIGQPFDVGCWGGECGAEFTVERIVVGGECVNPLVYEQSEGVIEPGPLPLPQGMELVQVWGTLAGTAPNPIGKQYGDDWTLLQAPEAWDPEMFKAQGEEVWDCGVADGYEPIGTQVGVGEQSKQYGAYWFPAEVTVLGFEGGRIDLGQAERQ